MTEPTNGLTMNPNRHTKTAKTDKTNSDEQSALTCPECTGEAIHDSVDPLQYVPQFASTLEVSDEAEYIACDLLRAAKTQNVHSGKSPSGLAAAALDAATHLTNEGIIQATVSDATRVSEVTIRDCYPGFF